MMTRFAALSSLPLYSGPTVIASAFAPAEFREPRVPQYRFHVFNDDHTIDDQGREFLNLDEARVYAINCIRRIMADELTTRGHIDLRHWIEIEDEHGDMHVVEFREGVTISS